MRRGFKARAERVAAEQRHAVGLGPVAPLPGERLARHLGHRIILPDQIPGMPPEALARLRADGSAWSAATLPLAARVVILNPTHSPGRQESNIMHELAHVLCGHEPKGIDLLGVLALRRYDPEQEDEAAWLGGCLQVPREALVWAIAGGMDTPAIAAYYGASEEMVTWRRSQTGVDTQFRHRRRRGW